MALDAEQLRRLQALERYDLEPIRTYLLKQGQMPTEIVDESLREFRRYLALRVLTLARPAMVSSEVDQIWHATILFTRLYADLCFTVFGYFVHHDPMVQKKADFEHDWHEFAGIFRTYFGEPGAIWNPWLPFSEPGEGGETANGAAQTKLGAC